jgi:hypothetical protein
VEDFGPPSWKVQAAARPPRPWRLIAFGAGSVLILVLAALGVLISVRLLRWPSGAGWPN